MEGDSMKTVAQNDVVQKSLRRLRQMGLNVNLQTEGDNQAFMFITLDSLLKLIEKQITYGNRKVYFEEPFIVVQVWRT